MFKARVCAGMVNSAALFVFAVAKIAFIAVVTEALEGVDNDNCQFTYFAPRNPEN